MSNEVPIEGILAVITLGLFAVYYYGCLMKIYLKEGKK